LPSPQPRGDGSLCLRGGASRAYRCQQGALHEHLTARDISALAEGPGRCPALGSRPHLGSSCASPRPALEQELLVSLGIEADRDKLARAVTAHRRPEIAARRPAKGAVNQKRGRKEREDPFPEELLRRCVVARDKPPGDVPVTVVHVGFNFSICAGPPGDAPTPSSSPCRRSRPTSYRHGTGTP